MDVTARVALEGESVTKCRIADVFVFFEVFYLSLASGRMWLIRCMFCCLRVEFVCNVGAWGARLGCYSFNGRNVFAACSAVGNVEQLLQPP